MLHDRAVHLVCAMSRWWNHVRSLALVTFLTGCSIGHGTDFPAHGHVRASLVQRLAPSIMQDLDQLVPAMSGHTDGARQRLLGVPAQYTPRLVLDILEQPWDGLMSLEKHSLLAAELAQLGNAGFSRLLVVLKEGPEKGSTADRDVPVPAEASADAFTGFMIKSLEEASRYRDKALAKLTQDDKQFVFSHGWSIVERFTPQISLSSDSTLAQAKADFRFVQLIEEQVDYGYLIAAAQILAGLADEGWLRRVAATFSRPVATALVPAGVTGEVFHVEETPYGLIVIGGPGSNTYELDRRFALVIDLGGDDVYRGTIAASSDPYHGNAVVIDVGGNDTYHGGPLGLATGRLGVGLLIDYAGDDVYYLAMGSGGAGFGGVGVLFDIKGNDIYEGSRLTQGASVAGLGLLLDLQGHDRYSSHGFAVGFGGPSGVGAVIDVEGDDHYRCGGRYPSAYNEQDAPQANPGDPLFQYDCFGLGTGAGQRMWTQQAQWQTLSLAGGWGLLLDCGGHDEYHGANFSQGHGYFWGTGTFLDLAGDDDYRAARYGQGSSAHHGAALFVDREGNDRYGSTGPFYNGGVAWDRGVSLMLDAGTGNDRYELERSSGLGSADHGGWGLFIDEGGDDWYRTGTGFGRSSGEGFAGFFDLHGEDSYPDEAPLTFDQRPGNGRAWRYTEGGVFVDR